MKGLFLLFTGLFFILVLWAVEPVVVAKTTDVKGGTTNLLAKKKKKKKKKRRRRQYSDDEESDEGSNGIYGKLEDEGYVKKGNYGTAGCGLGSVVFGKKKGIIQIFASTTNGLWGNQTFALTSGTSNCVGENRTAATLEQERFVASNYDALSKEMAIGRGEKLNALSKLIGCEKSANKSFGKMTKENLKDIIASNSSASSFVATIKTKIKTDKNLNNSCKVLY